MTNYFIIDDQLAELQTEEDITGFFKGVNFLQKSRDKHVFKEALQVVGRIDLVAKLERYIAICKLRSIYKIDFMNSQT